MGIKVENLFSYGTLRDEDVQRAVFGRPLDSTQDALAGYRLATMRVGHWEAAEISGGHLQQTLVPGDGEPVTGAVLHMTEEELRLADSYEPKEYTRIRVRLCSGTEAWVYLRT
jgi:gamma-glutamylcyclotransferase (GGCT)/AIG2-like uncharacterized protein YtfP